MDFWVVTACAELVQPVEDPGLEALLEHAISALDLPIRPGVCDGCPIDLDVLLIAELDEFPAGELRAIVRDDGVWYSKMMDDVKEEQHSMCRRTDQFIRIQVQWQSASGRTVILEPI